MALLSAPSVAGLLPERVAVRPFRANTASVAFSEFEAALLDMPSSARQLLINATGQLLDVARQVLLGQSPDTVLPAAMNEFYGIVKKACPMVAHSQGNASSAQWGKCHSHSARERTRPLYARPTAFTADLPDNHTLSLSAVPPSPAARTRQIRYRSQAGMDAEIAQLLSTSLQHLSDLRDRSRTPDHQER